MSRVVGLNLGVTIGTDKTLGDRTIVARLACLSPRRYYRGYELTTWLYPTALCLFQSFEPLSLDVPAFAMAAVSIGSKRAFDVMNGCLSADGSPSRHVSTPRTSSRASSVSNLPHTGLNSDAISE
jgi:hypothetical protein